MKAGSRFLRCAAVAAVAFATGCNAGASVSNASLPAARPDVSQSSPRSTGFRVLYRFSLAQLYAGVLPRGSLVYNNGYLWGTTLSGGSACSCGTVFAIHESGTQSPEVFAFNRTDGAHSWGGLSAADGLLYGTTEYGGASDHGTYFAINPANGQETVLRNFPGPPGLSRPEGPVLFAAGNAFMLSAFGGKGGHGAIYEDRYHNVSSFGGDIGVSPRGDLGYLQFEYKERGKTHTYGAVFGAATSGGRIPGLEGSGTVFAAEVSYDRLFVPLHLVNVANVALYGSEPRAGVTVIAPSTVIVTTTQGGTGPCPSGCGAIIAYNLPVNCGGGPFFCQWYGRVLHSFRGGADGETPLDAAIEVNNKLYGTTEHGGGGPCTNGCGTIYEVDPTTGVERILHRFDGADGASPVSDLLYVNGELYGTTFLGGGGVCFGSTGCGTVFDLHI